MGSTADAEALCQLIEALHETKGLASRASYLLRNRQMPLEEARDGLKTVESIAGETGAWARDVRRTLIAVSSTPPSRTYWTTVSPSSSPSYSAMCWLSGEEPIISRELRSACHSPKASRLLSMET